MNDPDHGQNRLRRKVTTQAKSSSANSYPLSICITLQAFQTPLPAYEVSKKEADRGAFKTPSLRNIALTAPYMHDGSLKTLKEVVDFYNRWR